jgi:hypothetical protein
MAQNYVLLERIELNASAASVTFSNIPQSGYTDLMLVTSTRVTDATGDDFLYARFNSSASGYSGILLRGNGSTAASGTIGTTYAYVGQIEGTGRTSNTFTNNTCYIPNYLGSSQKSYSTDTVTENNATAAYAAIIAGLWTGTAAISTIDLTPASGSFAQYSTFSLYGLAAVGTTPVIAPKASGGNITTDGTYWIHTFNSTGAFVPSQSLSCDYLVVAGGGGGGAASASAGGGGGGAGGYIYLTGQLFTANTSYTATIGAGGAGATSGSSPADIRGISGNNSVLISGTAVGGGGGGAYSANSAGINGGSGGGASGGFSTSSGGSATAGQGFNGGTGTSGAGFTGGGGGGGTQAGQNGGGTTYGGYGGAGYTTSISGTSSTYAGGGGGGANPAQGATTAGAGGSGGGGSGVFANGSGTANSGVANTGGGGGGNCGGSSTSGNGGSGIVIIRYTIA